MKFFLAAFLIGASLATACVTNPYIEIRKTFPVPLQVLPTILVNSSSTQCGSEWKTFGVCCNTSSLKAHVDADAANIKEAATKLVAL